MNTTLARMTLSAYGTLKQRADDEAAQRRSQTATLLRQIGRFDVYQYQPENVIRLVARGILWDRRRAFGFVRGEFDTLDETVMVADHIAGATDRELWR